jgi:MFS family permease
MPIMRPFGGAIFGTIGNKYGRKKVMIMTILDLSICTFLA